ncbi:MAG: DUF2085 domain-containing protein [Candidatus Methanofastidiosia archaeon]
MRVRYLYLLILFSEIIWVGGIVISPYLQAHEIKNVSWSLYDFYSNFCHQRADRSFFVFGEQMAVCARCFGIYAGVLIGTFIYPLHKKMENREPPHARWVLLSLVPLAVDGFSQLFGFRVSSNSVRIATGFLFGLVFINYFLPLVVVRLGVLSDQCSKE